MSKTKQAIFFRLRDIHMMVQDAYRTTSSLLASYWSRHFIEAANFRTSTLTSSVSLAAKWGTGQGRVMTHHGVPIFRISRIADTWLVLSQGLAWSSQVRMFSVQKRSFKRGRPILKLTMFKSSSMPRLFMSQADRNYSAVLSINGASPASYWDHFGTGMACWHSLAGWGLWIWEHYGTAYRAIYTMCLRCRDPRRGIWRRPNSLHKKTSDNWAFRTENDNIIILGCLGPHPTPQIGRSLQIRA